MPDQTPDVDRLRARLRELGYLDAGVNRFVLGGVGGGRGAFAATWRSSVRIGLLAGLLFGPSTAMVLNVAQPGLVTGLRDVVVLGVYLGGLFGVGVAGLSLVATLALSRMARGRRGPLLARAAGTLVALVCLAYMVLWWRTVNPAGTVWTSAAWTWPVLAFATAISMLLGHAVTLTTLAVEAQRSAAAEAPLPLASRSWLLTSLAAAAGFLVAAGILFLATRGETASVSAAPRLGAEPTGVRLTVIAVDGLDLSFAERLAASGRTPRLAKLLGGARLALPPSDAPDPARTWTSIATGQPADVHGVIGIEGRAVSGLAGTIPSPRSGLLGALAAGTDLLRLTRPALTTGLHRRSKTFWEVASECGLQTAVVNWWATWPAPAGRGAVISDRAVLRLERGGALDAEIEPPSLYDSLEPAWPALRDDARRRVLDWFPGASDPDAAVLRRAAEQDAVSVALAGRVFQTATDLRVVYLPGLDIAQHNLGGGAGTAGLPPSALAARIEALERYYAFLDALLSPWIDEDRPHSIVALLGDPGRSATGGPGVVAVAGAGVRAGTRGEGSRWDVVPTLLCLTGVPLSRELPGRPRLDLFDEALASRVRPRAVDTYGRRVVLPPSGAATPLDQEMLDRLRSLGYVR